MTARLFILIFALGFILGCAFDAFYLSDVPTIYESIDEPDDCPDCDTDEPVVRVFPNSQFYKLSSPGVER